MKHQKKKSKVKFDSTGPENQNELSPTQFKRSHEVDDLQSPKRIKSPNSYSTPKRVNKCCKSPKSPIIWSPKVHKNQSPIPSDPILIDDYTSYVE